MYLLRDKSVELYKSTPEQAPERLDSIDQYNKLDWRCAALSNNYFVAANGKTWLLWELGSSKMVVKFSDTIDPPGGIKCLAIHEDSTRSTSWKILVAVGLCNVERGVQQCQLHRIKHDSSHTVTSFGIPLVDSDPKMLSFSSDGTLLACTVYGLKKQSDKHSDKQYYEQVSVHEVEDTNVSSDPVCTISMDFTQVSVGHYPRFFRRPI